jgi:hypothetical protein
MAVVLGQISAAVMDGHRIGADSGNRMLKEHDLVPLITRADEWP